LHLALADGMTIERAARFAYARPQRGAQPARRAVVVVPAGLKERLAPRQFKTND